MKSDQDVLRTHDDVEMMKRPNLWPAWPLLPVKRTQGDRNQQCGVMVESTIGSPVKPTVYLKNIVDAKRALAESVKVEYADFEAVVDDGWVVD